MSIEVYYEMWLPGGYAPGVYTLSAITTTSEEQAVFTAAQTEGGQVWKIEYTDVDVPGVGLLTRRTATLVS